MNTQQIRPTVVVGVDGSASALRAVRWGAAEAGRRRALLRLVTAFGWEADRVVHAALAERYRHILLSRARSQLDEAAELAEREAPDIEVDREVVVGHAMAVLGDEALRAQLVVIGDSGLGRIDGLVVGSVAVALAAHASSPVVVVRGTEPARSAAALPVVVGVDEPSTSGAAVAFAFDAAAARQVPLVAVHTWWNLIADPAMAPLLDWDAIETDEHQVLSEQLAAAVEKYPDVRSSGWSPATARPTACSNRPPARSSWSSVLGVAEPSRACSWDRSAMPCCIEPRAPSPSSGPTSRRGNDHGPYTGPAVSRTQHRSAAGCSVARTAGSPSSAAMAVMRCRFMPQTSAVCSRASAWKGQFASTTASPSTRGS